MKKILGVLVLTVVFSSTALLGVYADDEKGKDKPDCPMMHKMAGDKEKMMGMMHGMKSSGGNSMVASSDGGVIVLSGSQLTKYDKNLNIVKQVEIEVTKKSKCAECVKKMGHEKKNQANDVPVPAVEHKEHK